MANEAILSNQAFLSLQPRAGEIDQAASWRQDLLQARYKALLIVPTSRRRRLEMVHQAMRGVILQPRRCTLLGLTQELAGFCREQRPLVGNVEQALRMARCLTDGNYPATPGMVRHLHRERRMLQAQPEKKDHLFAAILESYEKGLEEDRVWDHALQEKHLASELLDDQSPVSRYLKESFSIAFLDGFHKLTPGETQILKGLGRHLSLRLWFHGTSNPEWVKETESCLERMGVAREHQFPWFSQADTTKGDHHPAVEPDGPRVHWVELGQKRDLFRGTAEIVRGILERSPQAAPGRIAVVVSGAGEARLCRQALERTGIPCCAPAERVVLEESRLARYLLDALALRNGRISHEELSTFLLSPLAQKDLPHPYLLGKLLRLGLGVRGLRTPAEWARLWECEISNQVQRAQNQEDAEEETKTQANLRELAQSAGDLLERATRCILASDDSEHPGQVLADQLTEYLNQLKANTFLGGSARPEFLPPRDLQEDQLAW
ncbi:MAG: hypothetical protein ACKO23_07070, partial [Gemmataceae bacterium]